MRGQGQDFDLLSISEFCDIVWAQVCEPPPMSDSQKWRDAVYEAFYRDPEDTPTEAVESDGNLPADAQVRLAQMREIHRRNKERREQQAAGE